MIPTKPNHGLGRALIVFAAWLLFAGLALAQSAATGSIQGRVLNADNGNYLTNARVTIDGTELETFTDRYGQYRFNDVPAGPVKVRAYYTGLPEQILDVTVVAAQIATQDFSLSTTAAAAAAGGGVYKLDPFKVASKLEMDSAAIAINEQRFSATVKNVVATDAFGDIAEGNVGDFVKFLPGVTIDYVSPDARTISVRGVPANYTPVTLNANRIASANSSTAGRTFELEQISINNAGRIEVLKSRSPETAADALGGAINLVPYSALEKSKQSLSFRTFISANGDEKEFRKTRGPTNEASRKIKGGFDLVYTNPVTRNFGFTIGLLESNIYYPQHRTAPGWAPMSAASPGATIDTPYLRSYQVQDGPKNNQRESVSGTIDWKISPNDTITAGAQWNYYNASFSNRPVNYNVGAAAPVSFSPDFVNGAIGRGAVTLGGTSFRHKYGFTYAGDTTWKHNGPIWKMDAGLAFSHASNHYHDYQDDHFENVTLTLRGTPSSPAASSPTVNFASIAAGSYLVPTSIIVKDTAGVNTIDLSNPANYNITSAGFNPADSADVFKTAKFNIKRDLGLAFPFTVKAGGLAQEETRDIRKDNRGAWNFVGPDGIANTADDNASLYSITDPQYASGPFLFNTPQVAYPDPYRVHRLFLAQPSYFRPANAANVIINTANASQYFKEVISALYVMGDARLLRNRLRLVGGVRFENTVDDGYGVLNNPNAAKGITDPVAAAQAQYKVRGVHKHESYSGYYPSLDASFNVLSNLIARFAYAKSIGRPDLSNIIPASTVPDFSTTGTTFTYVNSSLKPTIVNAYDVSLEYYFQKTGVFSVGAFQKEFSNFTGAATVPATLELLTSLGIPDPQLYVNGGYNITTRFNVGNARVSGLEFNYSQVLDAEWMPQWTRRFTVYANGQQMHLEGSTLADFSNFIPASGSWGVKYGADKFSAQLNFNYRGRQRLTAQAVTAQPIINGVATSVPVTGYYDYFKPRIYIDTNVNYRLTKNFGFFLNARNLTNVAQDIQRAGPGTPSFARTYRREEFGVQYTLGLKGQF